MDQEQKKVAAPRPLLDMGESLKFNLKGGHINAALILVYSYLDAMASLIMPENQSNVKREDYICWVEKYMKTGADQPYQYEGKDFYGARCGLVHRYSPYSDLSEAGKCKIFAYSMYQDHKYEPAIDNNFVVISAPRLIQDFFKAMSRFIKDLLSDKQLMSLVSKRMNSFFAIEDTENH